MNINKNTQGGGATNLNSSVTKSTKANANNIFKPLIASSLALALSVSVGMAQTLGGDGSGSTCTTGPCFLITSDKDNATLGTLTAGTGNALTWSGASGLVQNGKTMTVTAKEVVVTYSSGSNNMLSMTGGNTFVGSFNFTNSTFVGSIISRQYNSSGSYNFSGNGNYTTTETGSTQFALVGNIIGDGGGSNPQFNFTDDANMKGTISTKYTEGEGEITVNFSGTHGNTLIGTIGSSYGLGTANVTFENVATIQAGSNGGHVMVAQPGNTSYTTNNLTLKAGGTITGNFIAGGDQGKGTNNLTLTTAGKTTINGNLEANWKGLNKIEVQAGTTLDFNGNILSHLGSNQFIFSGSGTSTIDGNLLAKQDASNEITVNSGVLNLTGNLSTSQGQNIIKFSSTATGSIIGNIGSDIGNTYIVNTGSGAISLGKNDQSNTITIKKSGGGNGVATYITDYDSSAESNGGFQNAPTGNGSLTLNLNGIIFENSSGDYWNQVGQKIIIDQNSGSATIDSKNSTQSIKFNNRYGNAVVLRFRDSESGSSSITLGSSGNNNGDLASAGVSGSALFQAKTITAYGNVKAYNGSTTYVWGNAININGGSISASADHTTLGDTQGKTKAVIVADGSDAIIKANTVSANNGSVYFLINKNANYKADGGLIGTDGSTQTTFSISGSGGASGAGIYITDYDSLNNDGFIEDLTASSITPQKANAAFNLNTTSIKFANNNGSRVGQSFVLDYDQGSATINSGTTTQSIYRESGEGHSLILRYRSATGNTSISIGENGGVDDGNGNKISNGDLYAHSKSKLLLQATAINVYGSISTSGTTSLSSITTASGGSLNIQGDLHTTGGTTILDYSAGSNANTITIGGILRTDFGSLTISDNTTADNTLSAQAIYSLGNYQIDGTSSITAKSVTVGFVGNVKSDSSGGLDTTPSNTITAETILINADLKGGANINGSTLLQQGGKVLLGASATTRIGESSGNVAIFNNMAKGSNTIISINNTKANDSKIYGDIYTFGGSNNIKLSGKADIAKLQDVNFVGNIYTNGGSNNFVFDKTYWAPHAVYADATSETAESTLTSGSIVTNGGMSNIVFRQDADLLGGKVGTFDITTTSGETNVVMQTNIAQSGKAIINYTGGTTNFIFAKANNIAGDIGDSFEANATNALENKILGVTYSDGIKLTLRNDSVKIENETVNLVDKFGNHFRNKNGNLFVLTSERGPTEDTITFDGLAIGEITSLANSVTAKTYNTTLNANSAFVGSITLASNSSATLKMDANSKLILTSDKSTISALNLVGNQQTISTDQLVLDTLSQTKNRVINLATNGGSVTNISQRSNFRLLEIGSKNGGANTGLLGNADETIIFTTYVNTNAKNATLGGEQASAFNNHYGYANADRIIIHDVGNTAGTSTAKKEGSVYLQFAVDANTDLGSIKYRDSIINGNGGTAIKSNVAVLTVKNSQSNGTPNDALIKLQTKDTLQGFDVISGTVQGIATDANGMTNGTSDVATGDYTTYFITSLSTTGADSAIQDTVSSAFATSLDIFAANFNSLNKRMGELRDNANSQGAWGRVFGGQQTSDFGLGSETTYVTVQAGYDYAFGFEGANNYLGFALAYSNSSSKTSNATNTLNGVSEGLDGDMKSNMVEVGIYNAYVQDEGWYNDSIFKFSYIMNDFSTTGTASGNSVSTTNYGIVLSDEFGYRFKLGDAKEWYIDPQLEVAFGYVNGTEYTLTSGRSELQAKSDSLMQLRARFGSSFGYDFKQFTQGKGVDAKLYVGAFYEYDYFNGGDVTLSTNLGGVNSIQSSLASDGRVVVNVGTNMTVKENTRIYFDFETSFAGKIRTDYQANVGVRYSFGENAGYTPLDPNKKSITPLKVSDKNAKENSSTETKSTEQTNEVSSNPETNTQEKAQ